jgi:large subunit ribosomal protein L21e
MKRIGGSRRKTRQKFTKPLREKGKLSLTRYFDTFEVGEKVLLKAEPSVHEGMYHGRFHGKVGVVQKQKGTCYEVQIDDLGKKKIVIVHPVHLKRV